MSAEDFIKLSVKARADFAMTGTSEKAELAFYRGLQYCALNNTHGCVPRSDLAQLGPVRVAAELVAHGYWEPIPQGWAFRNWDKWQREFEQLAAKRARDAERKREARRAARDEEYDRDIA